MIWQAKIPEKRPGAPRGVAWPRPRGHESRALGPRRHRRLPAVSAVAYPLVAPDPTRKAVSEASPNQSRFQGENKEATNTAPIRNAGMAARFA